jgi:mannose-6-phosphate isomerase-like protein (cupin superfamily)
MPDVTVKRVEDMEAVFEGSFVRARASLGARSFGMQVINMPANWENYPEHDHVSAPVNDRQEEIYTALSGKATLHVGGEEHTLEPGVFARVGASEKRKITTSDQGVQLLCVGGTPGGVFEPLAITELGGPTSW